MEKDLWILVDEKLDLSQQPRKQIASETTSKEARPAGEG